MTSRFSLFVRRFGKIFTVSVFNSTIEEQKINLEMILKVIIFGIFLVSCASAQDLEKLLKQAVTHRGYEDNPCTGRNDAHWAKNNRGCSWFYTCGANNVLIEQNRCEEGRHFSFEYQACGFKGEVPCNIPDIPAECPSNNFGILVVPHQYSCSKYTGEAFIF